MTRWVALVAASLIPALLVYASMASGYAAYDQRQFAATAIVFLIALLILLGITSLIQRRRQP